MTDEQRIEENRAVRNQLIEALQAEGLKLSTQYQISGDGFKADVNGRYSFDPICISVLPDYRLRKRGLSHSTYRVKRGEDPSPAIAKAVAKAKEFAAACVRARSAEEDAERRREEAEEAMRSAARLHFPDFKDSGTTRSGLYFTRDSDQCSVYLVCYDGRVEVEKVVFEELALNEAQAVVGVKDGAEAESARA